MEKTIRVYRDLMGANEKWARKTGEVLSVRKTAMLNLIGSPGSGKTALLEATAGAADGRGARYRRSGPHTHEDSDSSGETEARRGRRGCGERVGNQP